MGSLVRQCCCWVADFSGAITKPPGVPCSEWKYDCSVSDTILGTSIVMDVFGFLYIVLYIFLIRLAVSDLRKRPYHDNKMVSLHLSLHVTHVITTETGICHPM
jgi:hypothetical protein